VDVDIHRVTQRLSALAVALGVTAISGFGAVVGAFWGFGLKCDDSCGTPPPWRDDPDAWQWDALGVVAIAGFGFALLLLVGVALQWRLFSVASLLAWAVLAAWFIVLLDESGLTANPARGWAGLVVAALSAAAAIALTPSRRRA
jgi:hypothetical protein